MPNVQAVRSAQHNQYSWLPYTHYRFAAGDAHAPLVVQEFTQAGATAPIAFTQNGGTYSPVLMMGLHTGINLLVSSSSGKWLGHYVPAFYRSHPFCMTRNQDGKTLLSVHSDSEFVLDHIDPSKGKPFFSAGDLSEELREILNFLRHVETGRKATTKFCATCADYELFSPWELQVNTGRQLLNIKGLHRIDESKLKALSADKAKALLGTGAMGAIYYHLGSLQHIKTLVSLNQRRDEAAGKDNTDRPIPGIFTNGADHEPLPLDWSSIVKNEH